MVRRRESRAVRRRARQGTPAPWARLILDSGGLSAVAENQETARAALDLSATAGTPVLVPTTVLAEVLRGDARDARMNQVLGKLQVVPLTEDLAREAAYLKTAADLAGVEETIDATVVAVATLLGGGAVLTSDPRDIQALAAARPDVRVKAIAV